MFYSPVPGHCQPGLVSLSSSVISSDGTDSMDWSFPAHLSHHEMDNIWRCTHCHCDLVVILLVFNVPFSMQISVSTLSWVPLFFVTHCTSGKQLSFTPLHSHTLLEHWQRFSKQCKQSCFYIKKSLFVYMQVQNAFELNAAVDWKLHLNFSILLNVGLNRRMSKSSADSSAVTVPH